MRDPGQKDGGERAGQGSVWQPNPTARPAEANSAAAWRPSTGAGRPERPRRWRGAGSGGPAVVFGSPAAPVLTFAALIYPWQHPTWASWLGLAVMYSIGMVALHWLLIASIMLARIIGFIGVISFGSVVLVAVVLLFYALHVFVEIVQQTAYGSDRLERLPAFDWVVLIPSALSVMCAAGLALLMGWLGGYWCHASVGLNELAVAAVMVVTFLLLFPLFFLANMAEGTILPFAGLLVALRALVQHAGSWLAVLLAGCSVACAAGALLRGLYAVNPWLGHLSQGPVAVTALMIYGHLLGRLARRMMAGGADEQR